MTAGVRQRPVERNTHTHVHTHSLTHPLTMLSPLTSALIFSLLRLCLRPFLIQRFNPAHVGTHLPCLPFFFPLPLIFSRICRGSSLADFWDPLPLPNLLPSVCQHPPPQCLYSPARGSHNLSSSSSSCCNLTPLSGPPSRLTHAARSLTWSQTVPLASMVSE